MSSYTEIDVKQDDEIITIDEVIAKTSLGKTTIYRQMKAGTFPKQVNLGGQRVGWLKSDITRWLQKLKHTHVSG